MATQDRRRERLKVRLRALYKLSQGGFGRLLLGADSPRELYVRRNGGSDAMIAPSMRVHLHTKKGPVDGVFGWPAIHVRDLTKDVAPKVTDLTIDVGAATKQEVEEMGIHVGTVATFTDGLMELNGRYYVGNTGAYLYDWDHQSADIYWRYRYHSPHS